jgi:hypothetical protein
MLVPWIKVSAQPLFEKLPSGVNRTITAFTVTALFYKLENNCLENTAGVDVMITIFCDF